MDVFTMVVVIVTVSCLAGVINNYLKTRRVEQRNSPGPEVEAELAALKQRVAVLEEIVTDEGYRLHREIDRLERQA